MPNPVLDIDLSTPFYFMGRRKGAQNDILTLDSDIVLIAKYHEW